MNNYNISLFLFVKVLLKCMRVRGFLIGGCKVGFNYFNPGLLFCLVRLNYFGNGHNQELASRAIKRFRQMPLFITAIDLLGHLIELVKESKYPCQQHTVSFLHFQIFPELKQVMAIKDCLQFFVLQLLHFNS